MTATVSFPVYLVSNYFRPYRLDVYHLAFACKFRRKFRQVFTAMGTVTQFTAYYGDRPHMYFYRFAFVARLTAWLFAR
jgi:hypothetical protein